MKPQADLPLSRLLLATTLSLSLAVAGLAQSPLSTTFASNNGGNVGGGVYFDLDVIDPAGVTISRIDVNTPTPGNALVLDVLTRPGGRGFPLNLGVAAWTGPSTLGSTFTGAGVDQPSAVTLAHPLVLPPGNWGVAFRAVNFAHRYTNGNGANQVYTNADLSLSAGEATNVAFNGSAFSPRVANCCIHYTTATGTAFAPGQYVSIGAPCVLPNQQAPHLSAITVPELGASFDLEITNAQPNSLGAFVIGLSNRQFSGGWLPYEMSEFGAPNCWLGVAPHAFSIAVIQPGGTAPYSMAIPNQPFFFGASIYAQGILLDGSSVIPTEWGAGFVGGQFVPAGNDCDCVKNKIIGVIPTNKKQLNTRVTAGRNALNQLVLTLIVELEVDLTCGPMADNNCSATLTPTITTSWLRSFNGQTPVIPVAESQPGPATTSAVCTAEKQTTVVRFVYSATFAQAPNLGGTISLTLASDCNVAAQAGTLPPDPMVFKVVHGNGTYSLDTEHDGDIDGDGKADSAEKIDPRPNQTHRYKWDTNGDGTEDQ